MMTVRGLAGAFLFGSVACAQTTFPLDTPAVESSFSHPCDLVRPAALAYFQKQAFSLSGNVDCVECLAGTTKSLHDEAGHRLLSNRKVIRTYSTDDLKYERPGPLAYIVHTDLRTNAYLRLQPEGEGCRAALHFLYTWYGAELVLGFPVDGDRGHSYSNGKLEAAYLHSLQQQVGSAGLSSTARPID